MFSGIGFQRMALRDIGAEFESWRTCEWDVNAIRQYKAIHCNDDNKDYSHDKTKEQLVDILWQAGISSDGKKPMEKKKLINKNEKWLREVYNNCYATLNLVDISKVTGDSLQIKEKDKYCYILTYSFPCQSLSIAGLQNGMKESSGTASSLLWEVKRILSECAELPQILLMENVIQIHSKKNFLQFKKWIKFLESIGYSNFWQDMNAKNYGIPQSRNRTFMISILDPTRQVIFDFPKSIKLNKEFIDFLVNENLIENKYYINSSKTNEIIQQLFLKDSSTLKKERTTIDLSLVNPEEITIANCITAHLAKDGGNWIERRKSKNNGVVVLLNNNTKNVYNIKYKIRKITPQEAFRLMGCSDEDFKKAENVASNTGLYRTAGNGIAKSCLEAIFCQMNIKNVPTWEEYSKKY